MSAKSQSDPPDHENQNNNNPPSSNAPQSSQSHPAEDDDEDFVDISDEDTDMRDADADDKPRTKDDLDLHRLSANSDHDFDDDSDEEHDSMASHPLLSMLTGRLGGRRRGSTHKWDSLHPVTQVLSVSNVDDCTKLEDQAFPENERCSREKVYPSSRNHSLEHSHQMAFNQLQRTRSKGSRAHSPFSAIY